MRSTWALLFVLMNIAGFGGAATAQTPDQQRCAAPDPDLSISGCTAMIQSGRETQEKNYSCASPVWPYWVSLPVLR